MDPLTIAGASVTSTWLWDKYGKEFIDKLSASAKNKWNSFKEHSAWQKAAEQYRLSLQRQYSTIRLLGKSQPVELENIFTDVYILDEITARQRYSIETLKQQYPERFNNQINTKRINGMDIVKQGKNLFILGKPGAGKTTFLKYITLQIVKGELENIPIFISLKEWSDSKFDEITPFIVKQFEICGLPDAQSFIEYLLETGRAIILFDGLDEVLQEDNQRSHLITLISDFSKQYPISQTLITCRIAANEYTFERFQDIEIADFTEDQINTFAKKWFQDDEKKYIRFTEEFNKTDNQGLKELASTPLLLALLCLTFESNLSFPHRRAELYEDALDTLLRRWDTSRNIRRDTIYHNLSLRLKQRMFSHIAAETFETGEYFIQQKNLEKRILTYLENLPNINIEKEIDSYQILKSIESQHSIFVERAQHIYSFSHLTIQEYYTARYITDNEARGTTKKLIDQHLLDSRWHEVFLLTSSLLDEADDFFNYLTGKINQLINKDTDIQKLLIWANKIAENIAYDNKSRMNHVNFAITLASNTGEMFDYNEMDKLNIQSIKIGDIIMEYTKIQSENETKQKYHLNIQLTLEQLARNDSPLRLNSIVKMIERIYIDKRLLHSLSIRSIGKKPEYYHITNNNIRKQLINQGIIQRLHLSKNQQEILEQYMETSHLLMECLEVSGYLSNRNSIETMILNPS